jgi:predicted RNA-binding Zn-ribbon protein involved in translation (DUF1610 family)
VAKKLPVQRAICTECHSQLEAAPTLTFFGLLRFTCPHCGKAFLHPMSTRRRKVYRAIAIGFGLFSLVILLMGAIPIPGILPAGAVAGLIQDSNVRKKLAMARVEVRHS